MSTLAPEGKHRPLRSPLKDGYILADAECDNVLAIDGDMLDLDEAAADPRLVRRFDTESAARKEQVEQDCGNFRQLQILRKRVG